MKRYNAYCKQFFLFQAGCCRIPNKARLVTASYKPPCKNITTLTGMIRLALKVLGCGGVDRKFTSRGFLLRRGK